jgi:hypothetical protein
VIIHTLIYSFSPAMTAADHEEFFREVAGIMLGEGQAVTVEHRIHLPLPTDEHAPVFSATAVAQVTFPNLEALAETSALPSMRTFVGHWQTRFPYRVVWANHEPF